MEFPITNGPEIRSSELVFAGPRLPADTSTGCIRDGSTADEFPEVFPCRRRGEVIGVLEYAGQTLAHLTYA